MKNIIISAAACLLAAAPFARAASIYTESFSNDGNTEGWFEVTDASTSTFGQNPGSDTLTFSGLGYGLFYAAADSASSGGAFAGNYAAAGISGISFQLAIAPGSTVSGLFIEIANVTDGVTWQYAFAPVIGAATAYFVSLSDSAWNQTTGAPAPFAAVLSGVEEVGIALTGDGSGDFTAALDNVSTVPEPSALVLSFAGLLGLARRKR